MELANSIYHRGLKHNHKNNRDVHIAITVCQALF